MVFGIRIVAHTDEGAAAILQEQEDSKKESFGRRTLAARSFDKRITATQPVTMEIRAQRVSERLLRSVYDENVLFKPARETLKQNGAIEHKDYHFEVLQDGN